MIKDWQVALAFVFVGAGIYLWATSEDIRYDASESHAEMQTEPLTWGSGDRVGEGRQFGGFGRGYRISGTGSGCAFVGHKKEVGHYFGPFDERVGRGQMTLSVMANPAECGQCAEKVDSLLEAGRDLKTGVVRVARPIGLPDSTERETWERAVAAVYDGSSSATDSLQERRLVEVLRLGEQSWKEPDTTRAKRAIFEEAWSGGRELRLNGARQETLAVAIGGWIVREEGRNLSCTKALLRQRLNQQNRKVRYGGEKRSRSFR